MTGLSTHAPTKVLTLWASEKSPNLGVAVLARGSTDLLRRALPGADVVCISSGTRPREVPWGLPRSLIRERVQRRFGMQDYFASFDLIWDTRSGDSFADIYGLDRHTTMGLVHEFAVQSGTPVVMAPQTIGPFSGQRARWIARRNLLRSRRVFARDPESYSAAESLGRRPDGLSADLVFAIEPATPTTRRDVLFNVSGLLWNENPHVDAAAYRGVVIESVQRLIAAGRNVALFAHVLDSPSPDNDIPALHEAERMIGKELELVVPADLSDARSTIAGADLVIASRMHACLNALSLGIPTVPLAYSRKFAPLLSSVGWETGFDLRTDETSTVPGRLVHATTEVTHAQAAASADAGRSSLRLVEESVRHLLEAQR